MRDGTGGTEITRIDAKSNVHVMSEDDQSASGDWALYMVANETITMGDTSRCCDRVKTSFVANGSISTLIVGKPG